MDVPFEMNAYTRVLKLASTPDRTEFYQVAGVSALGIFLVGLMGFLLFVVMNALPP